MNLQSIINKIHFGLILLFIQVASNLYSQSSVIDCKTDLQLLQYMTVKGKYSEAILLANDLLLNRRCQSIFDSVYFFKGLAFYQTKQFDSAVSNLLKVKSPDTLFIHSRILSSVNLSYKSDYSGSLHILGTIKPRNEVEGKLLNIQNAGNNLLLRNFQIFDSTSKSFTYNYFATQNERKKFKKNLFRINSFRLQIACKVGSPVNSNSGWWKMVLP